MAPHISAGRNRFSLHLQLSSFRDAAQSSVSSKPDSANLSSLVHHPPTNSITSDVTRALSSANSFGSELAQTPLLSSRPSTGRSIEPPSTLNELDAKERTRLLKKARKLSQVFGEMPSLEVPAPSSGLRSDDRPLHTRSSSASLSRKLSASSGRKFLVRRSSRPNVGKDAPSSLAQVEETPCDQMRVSPQLEAANPEFSRKDISSPHQSSNTLDLHSFKSSIDGDNQSSISSASSAPAPEQARRMGASKFTRQLGENIAPEFVAGPSKRGRRRKSLDMSSFDTSAVALPVSPGLKRSRSLWARNVDDVGSSHSQGDFQQRYLSNFGADSRLTPRERSRKVKRARKMAQVPVSSIMQTCRLTLFRRFLEKNLPQS